MTLSLIVNPAAGGGRAGRALDGVGAALAALGLEHHVEPTRSLGHARQLARMAVAAGETAVAFGGDGLIGAVADALRGSPGLLGVLPGGRGNDFARALGMPLDPRAACDVLATGTTRALDLGEVNGRTFVGIASCGIDADANRIANRTRLIRGNLSTPTRHCGRLPSGGPPRSRLRSTAAARTPSPGTRSRRRTPAPTAAECGSRPRPGSMTACWRS